LPDDNAVETLDRNSPSGLLASALAGVSFCACARYFSAAVVLPDWMAEIRLVNAVLKEFWPLDELVAEVEVVVRFERRALAP